MAFLRTLNRIRKKVNKDRRTQNKILRQHRKIDRQNGARYTMTFGAGLKELSDFYGVDIRDTIREIMKSNPNPKILEIGAGEGNGARELAKDFPELELHATGLAKIPQMQGEGVNWHVSYPGIFERTFKGKKFDFVHSNFGIGDTKDVREAVKKTGKVMNKGGILIFTSISNILIPKEFKLMDKGYRIGKLKNGEEKLYSVFILKKK